LAGNGMLLKPKVLMKGKIIIKLYFLFCTGDVTPIFLSVA